MKNNYPACRELRHNNFVFQNWNPVNIFFSWKINVVCLLCLLHVFKCTPNYIFHSSKLIAQWLSGRVLDTRWGAAGSSLTGGTALWSLSNGRHIYSSLVLVQPRKTHPCLTERLLMGRKNKNKHSSKLYEPWSSTLLPSISADEKADGFCRGWQKNGYADLQKSLLSSWLLNSIFDSKFHIIKHDFLYGISFTHFMAKIYQKLINKTSL